MNQLKLSQQQSILTLHRAGWSNRAIARELHLDRETVGKYLRAQPAAVPDASAGTMPSPAGTAAVGAGADVPSKPAISIPGSTLEVTAQPALTSAGSVAGRKSCCAVWEAQIVAARELGLTAQRIYQDLVTEYQFTGSYQSVIRTSCPSCLRA